MPDSEDQKDKDSKGMSEPGPVVLRQGSSGNQLSLMPGFSVCATRVVQAESNPGSQMPHQ